jgi:hypothetical protein
MVISAENGCGRERRTGESLIQLVGQQRGKTGSSHGLENKKKTEKKENGVNRIETLELK